MDEQTPKPRRGCFFYGCFGFSILFLVVLVASMLGYRYAKRMFNEFTDTRPMPLPAVALSPSEIDRVEQRVDIFRTAVREHKPTPPLQLTADEINALIFTNADLQDLRGKLYVMIEGDQLKGKVSVPMEDLGLPAFRARYFNGTGTFKLTFHDGFLRINPETLLAKGKPLPAVYMDKIRKTNLADDLNSNPRAVAALEWIHDIRIKDGRLVIVPKENK